MSNNTENGYAPKGYANSSAPPEPLFLTPPEKRFHTKGKFIPHTRATLIETLNKLYDEHRYAGRRQSRRQLRRPKTPKRKTRRH
jgi:hypothetical protein